MTHIQQARESLARGRVQDALQLIDGLMQNGRPGAELLLLHAQALLAAGRARDAIPAFHRAVEAAPNQGLVDLGLAIACGQSGDAVAAERAARSAIAKNYDNAGSRFVLARALLGQGRHEEAEAIFRDVLRLQPDDVQALVNLGESVWQRTGSAEQASAAIAALSRSASPELTLFQARLARESRGHEAELAMLEQALERQPSNLPLRLASVRAALMCDAARALRHAEIAIRGGGAKSACRRFVRRRAPWRGARAGGFGRGRSPARDRA